MTEIGFATGRPLPNLTRFWIALWTYSVAILHASVIAMPFAIYAATAEEKLQPEPWLSFIFSRGFVNLIKLPLPSRQQICHMLRPKMTPLYNDILCSHLFDFPGSFDSRIFCPDCNACKFFSFHPVRGYQGACRHQL